jgi:hypothetical protein
MGAMRDVRANLLESRKGNVCTPAVARHQDDTCPKSGQPDSGNLSDTGRGAGDDDDLAVNERLLGSSWGK